MRLPSVKWSPFAMPFGLINLLCSGYFLTSHPCSQELSSFWFLCYSTLEREVPPWAFLRISYKARSTMCWVLVQQEFTQLFLALPPFKVGAIIIPIWKMQTLRPGEVKTHPSSCSQQGRLHLNPGLWQGGALPAPSSVMPASDIDPLVLFSPRFFPICWWTQASCDCPEGWAGTHRPGLRSQFRLFWLCSQVGTSPESQFF